MINEENTNVSIHSTDEKDTGVSIHSTNEDKNAKLYSGMCMDIVKQIMKFADENGEDRKECFMIVARMLERASRDLPEKVLDLL